MTQPWAENQWPTPEQLCDWVLSQPREQQLEHFRKTIERSEMAAHCFMMNHKALQEEVGHLRGQVERAMRLMEEMDKFINLYKGAWDAVIACGECQDRSEVLEHFNKRARAYGLREAGK